MQRARGGGGGEGDCSSRTESTSKNSIMNHNRLINLPYEFLAIKTSEHDNCGIEISLKCKMWNTKSAD